MAPRVNSNSTTLNYKYLVKGINIKVKKLKLLDDSFLFGSKRYSYDKIIGLYYKDESATVNFIKSSSVSMKLKLVDGSILSVSAGGIFQKKSMELIRKAYSILRQITLNNRFNYYLRQFKRNGFIEYKYFSKMTEAGSWSFIGIPTTVRIYAQGYIEKNGKRYDLRIAKQSGILEFGSNWSSGLNSSYDPTQIVISEKHIKLFPAIRTLRINAVWDTEIIHAIIRALSKGKSLF